MTDKETVRDKRGWTDDETHRKGQWGWLANSCGTAADRRNQFVFAGWTLAWALTFTAAVQTLKGNLGGLELEGPTAWVMAVFPNVVAVGMLLAYLRFLRMADELTRLIQLQGLAVGFGAWIFSAMAWKAFEAAGATFPDDVLFMVPILAMSIGTLYFAWRYR